MESGTELIYQETSRHRVPVTPEQVQAMAHFVATLGKWNRALRLTADARPSRVIGEHLPDALVLARVLAEQGDLPAAAVDIGSGAGFPALPLAILLPRTRFTLVEPRQRRCSFLRTCLHELGLTGRCSVLGKRLEEIDLPPAGLATSKATFPPDRWLDLAPPLIGPGGTVVLLTTEEALAPPRRGPLQRLVGQAYRSAGGAPRFIALYRTGA